MSDTPSAERIDFGEPAGFSSGPGHLKIWVGPDTGQPVSRRLIDAMTRGEVTKGGLAEAGWFVVGTSADCQCVCETCISDGHCDTASCAQPD